MINIISVIIIIIIMIIQEGWPTVFMPAPDAGAGNPSSKGTAAADAAAGPHAGSAAAIGTPTPSQRKRRQNTLLLRGKTPPAKPMKSAMKARRPRAPSTSSVSCSGSPDKRDCRVHKVLISGPTAEQNPRVEVCGVVMFQKRKVKTHVKTFLHSVWGDKQVEWAQSLKAFLVRGKDSKGGETITAGL